MVSLPGLKLEWILNTPVDLMLVERTQAEEAEQEMRAKLLRSRNKKDDNPDHEKRKKEAKLKQQAQQEAEQQKQADATALAASNRRRQPAGAVSQVYIDALNRTPCKSYRLLTFEIILANIFNSGGFDVKAN